MQREELLKILFSRCGKEESIVRSLRYIKINQPDLYQEILNHTSHLPDDTNSAERFYHLYHDLHTIQLCKTPGCGKKVNLIGFFKGYSEHCCKACTTRDPQTKHKSQQSCIDKFGVKNPMQNDTVKEKGKNTTREKYGVDHIRQSKEFRDKYEQTCLEKYGVKNPNSLDSVKEKKKQTCLDKFATECSFQSDIVKSKIYQSNIIKFLKRFHDFLDSIDLELSDHEYINETHLHTFNCKRCNNEFQQTWNVIQQGYRCPTCYPRPMGSSKNEKEVCDFLQSINVNFIENTKAIISPYELDIFIASHNIAIEFDGVYWHSHTMVDKDYHLNKTQLCQEKGIRLIHIFEDEWLFKREIVKDRLRQILNISDNRKKIHARKCIIREITSSEKNDFLNMYHLQGGDISRIHLGSFYKNELVSVMTFGHSNIAKGLKNSDDRVWELNRFCIKRGYIVTGIASKLLSYFKKNYDWYEIYSYADRRWSVGDIYKKLGFDFVHNTPINYWYTKGNARIHRFSLRKRPDEPKDKTEFELREAEGYHRIYDCGSMKFIMKNDFKTQEDKLTF